MGISMFWKQNCTEIKTKYVHCLKSYTKCSDWNTKRKISGNFLKGRTNHKRFLVIFSSHDKELEKWPISIQAIHTKRHFITSDN